ncbi:MAG: hypothetical protein LBF24_01890 [Puniceicoccales bacterium]|nr:hypothetical protein [Puniceicoccales bacterium]
MNSGSASFQQESVWKPGERSLFLSTLGVPEECLPVKDLSVLQRVGGVGTPFQASTFPSHGCLSGRVADQVDCAKKHPEALFFTITAIYRGFNIWLHQGRVLLEVAMRFSSFEFGGGVTEKVGYAMSKCDRLIKGSILLRLNDLLRDSEFLFANFDRDVGGCNICVCVETAFQGTETALCFSIRDEHITFAGECFIDDVGSFDEWCGAVEELRATTSV